MAITKQALRAALGLTKDTELAEFFTTSKQAVFGWGETDPIPEGRQWQARALRPDLFDDAGNLIRVSAASDKAA